MHPPRSTEPGTPGGRHARRCRELGICYRCGKRAVPNTSLCAAHRKEVNQKTLKRYARARRLKICWRCGRPAKVSMLCAKHQRDQRKQQKRDRDRRRARKPCRVCGRLGHASPDHKKLRLCVDCGEPATAKVSGARVYGAHRMIRRAVEREREAIQRKQAIAKGFCGRCKSRPIAPDSSSRCVQCLAYNRQYMANIYDPRRRAGKAEDV
jgi:hypothetical protein